MFETSQWADADAAYPVLTAAITGLPTPHPGGDAITAGGQLRALLILQRRLQARVLEAVASFDAQGFATGYGSASTQAWVRAYASLDPGQAAALDPKAQRNRRHTNTTGLAGTPATCSPPHLAAVLRLG